MKLFLGAVLTVSLMSSVSQAQICGHYFHPSEEESSEGAQPTGGGSAADARTNEVVGRIAKINPNLAASVLEWIEHGNTGKKTIAFEGSPAIEGKLTQKDFTPEQKRRATLIIQERLALEPSDSDCSDYPISKNLSFWPGFRSGGNKLEQEVRSIAAEMNKSAIDQLMTNSNFLSTQGALREFADQQVQKLRIFPASDTETTGRAAQILWIKNPDSSFTLNSKAWDNLNADQKKETVKNLYKNLSE